MSATRTGAEPPETVGRLRSVPPGTNPVSNYTPTTPAPVEMAPVTGTERDPTMPDVPTFAEAGFPGIEVYVWYAGLSSPALHIARVKARVKKGGHDIPAADIRRRYQHSRLNLIHLLPHLAALRVYDNSADADPAAGRAPEPVLVLHRERGSILNQEDLPGTPDWARPIVAAALQLRPR